MNGLHILDYLAILAYLAVVIYLGKRASHGAGNEEGYFLAGRKLGKGYQFFLNFGNATDANGAVSTASLVYQQGAPGVWLSLQTLFMNPYYWFMNMWFRRVRLVTVADLFEDRFGSRSLARFYAIFQIIATVVVIIGFGNFVAYKISASLMVKQESAWTVEERRSVEEYREMKTLEQQARVAPLAEEAQTRLRLLQERDARGELNSYITVLEPWTFYLIYTFIVGFYIVMGGLAAAAVNEAFQGSLIVVFSLLLIPGGLTAIGGWGALSERVPEHMFSLLSDTGASQVTLATLLAILFVSLIQIHGIIGNMSVAGSAKDEMAARFGAVSGTYAKRIMIILWAIAGLIAVAIFQGADALSDPDSAWGALALRLLGPGFLGLMLAGLLAANMSTVAAQTMAVSALFVRNVYRYLRRSVSDGEMVFAGRISVVVILCVGVLAAMSMTNVFSVIQLLLTVNVPFGAAVVLIFFWRKLTAKAVWTAVVLSTLLNIVYPQFPGVVPGLRESPALTVQTTDETGRSSAVYFERVVRRSPNDLTSPLVGVGRFHVELWVLDQIGFDPVQMSSSGRFAARFFFDGAFPFLVLIVVSLFTRRPEQERIDQFFGKMKTPVGKTPALEAEAMAETHRNPRRYDDRKLFPRSSWEFTKWDKVDTVGFLVCCGVTGAILLAFWGILRWAAA